jgi:formylglycine-generating enzyme required for sulfatase activity
VESRLCRIVASLLGLGLCLSVLGCSPGKSSKKRSSAKTEGSSAGGIGDGQPLFDTNADPAPWGDPYKVDMGDGVAMEFIWVSSGNFVMGDKKNGLRFHRQKIDAPYYLGKYEVTQRQWTHVMSSNASRLKDPDNPVEKLNWDDCLAFCRKMTDKYGEGKRKFVLPSEAQWEFACRAGNNLSKIKESAWHAGNSQCEPHAVGQKEPNAWGFHDMHGNVAEWCSDVLPPSAGPNKDDPSKEEWHVVRGGNYRDGAGDCTAASRALRRAVVPLRFDGMRLMCVPLEGKK